MKLISVPLGRWRRVRPWLQVGLMLLAGWFVYSPALRGDWLWDDLSEIQFNTTLRDRAGLARIWISPPGPDYFPIKSSLQWLQWHLWGEARLGYHLSSLGFHLLGGFLLWRLLEKLGLRFAFFGGLLFVVHPLAVESVAWISELKNVLSLPWLFLAFSAFLDFDARNGFLPTVEAAGASAREAGRGVPKRRRVGLREWTEPERGYLLSLVFFLIALLCKTSVVMFPFVLLLHAWWKRGRIRAADAKAAAPFFILALLLGGVTVWFQHHYAIAGWHLYQGNFWSRAAGAGVAIVFYFCKFVWPTGLLPIYPRWARANSLQLAHWAVLRVTLAWIWDKRSGWGRHAIFGLGFFLINLAPVLGFVPMSFSHIASVADHFVYLPMVGLVGLAAAGLGAGAAMAGRPGAVPRWIAAGAICAFLAIVSRNYAAKFADQETLWTYALAHNPGSPAVHSNLAFILRHDGRMAEAIAQYKEALRQSPDDAYLETEFADTLVAAGRRQEGIEHYRRAVFLDSNLIESHSRLGDSLARDGQRPEAVANYHEALRLHPDLPDVENSLGVTLADGGNLAEAILHYQTALRLKPGFAEAENNLGLALAKQARWNEAIAHFETALRLNPGLAKAHDNLGYALDATGHSGDAVAQFEIAARLQPDVVEYQNNLGFALARSGRPGEAVAHFERAIRIHPDDAAAHYNLGAVLEASGRLPEARAHFLEALRINPNFVQARDRLKAMPPLPR